MKYAKKLPPYGAALAERQKFLNLPFLAVICVGKGSWQRAKQWNQRPDDCAMVLPSDIHPTSYVWPVSGCACVIEWDVGPKHELIIQLARCLLMAGAETVIVWPRWTDFKQTCFQYDANLPIGKRWVQSREMVRVYHGHGGQHARA